MISEATVSTATRSSLLGRWEARYKLIGFLILIFSFALVQELRLLPVMLLTAFSLYRLTALPLSYLISRLRLPGFFLLATGLILPFWSGQTVLWQLGPLAVRLEGALSLLVIAVKFISILTLATALFASTPLPLLAGALRGVGVPWLLTDMLLFTYRYFFQLAGDLQRTRTAARLRGFRGKTLFSLKTLAYITGSLLVRSHAQAERIFQAMTLRGYGCSARRALEARPTPMDRVILAAVILHAAAFILAQTLL